MDFTENPEWKTLFARLVDAYNQAEKILAEANTTATAAKNEKCTAFNVLCRLDNACKAVKKAREKNRKAMVRQ